MNTLNNNLKIVSLHIEDYMLPCMTKKLIGMDCPGCGLQRSVVHLFKGEFSDAWHMYPAIYPMALLLIIVGLSQFYKLKFDFQIKVFLGVLTALVIVVNYILKLNNLIN